MVARQMTRFSERMGFKPARDAIQISGIDDALRNSLWSAIYEYYGSLFRPGALSETERAEASLLWRQFFKLPIDTIPHDARQIVEYLRKWYFSADWYEAYDLIEFIEGVLENPQDGAFRKQCNYYLEVEMSGFRFVGI